MDRWLGGHDSAWEQLESTALWQKAMSRFLRFVTPENMSRILVIGSGCGPLLQDMALRTAQLHVVDDDNDRLTQAKATYEQALYQHCGRGKLPFSDGFFDLVYIIGATSSRAELLEMKRVTKKGGTIATLFPSQRIEYARLMEAPEIQALSEPERSAMGALLEHIRQCGEFDGDIGRLFVSLELFANRTVELVYGAFLMSKGRVRL